MAAAHSYSGPSPMLATRSRPMFLAVAAILLPLVSAAAGGEQGALRGQTGARSIDQANLEQGASRLAHTYSKKLRNTCERNMDAYEASTDGVALLTNCVTALSRLSSAAREQSIKSGALNREYSAEYGQTINMIAKVGEAASRARATVMQDTKHAQKAFRGQIGDIIRDLDLMKGPGGGGPPGGGDDTSIGNLEPVRLHVSPRGHMKRPKAQTGGQTNYDDSSSGSAIGVDPVVSAPTAINHAGPALASNAVVAPSTSDVNLDQAPVQAETLENQAAFPADDELSLADGRADAPNMGEVTSLENKVNSEDATPGTRANADAGNLEDGMAADGSADDGQDVTPEQADGNPNEEAAVGDVADDRQDGNPENGNGDTESDIGTPAVGIAAGDGQGLIPENGNDDTPGQVTVEQMADENIDGDGTQSDIGAQPDSGAD